MKISAELLNKLRGIRDARNAASVLPDAMSPEQLSSMKKRVWQEIRRTYNLPDRVKFKVELDGEKAGELRYKDNGLPYTPPTIASQAATANRASATSAGSAAGVKYVVIDDDDERVLTSFEDLVEWLRDNHGVRVVTVV